MIKTENPYSSKVGKAHFNEQMIDTTIIRGANLQPKYTSKKLGDEEMKEDFLSGSMRRQPEKDLGDVNLQEDLKPLWVACYFDRRLTKNQVQALDLRHTMRLIRELISKDEFGTDFRRVYPFVFGFIKILLRKFNFLISESTSTLDSLKNPFAEEDVEEIPDNAATKKRVRAGEPKRDAAFQAPGALKNKKAFIDMSNIKFPGIDKQVLLRLEEAIKRDVTEMQAIRGGDHPNHMKRDEEGDNTTFLADDMRNGGIFLSAIKQEGGAFEPDNDLRNQIDVQGNFLNDISGNFGLASPIVPSSKPDQMRFNNAYEHNMNLTMEMQKLVNEHLRMEDYDEQAPAHNFDIPMDYAGEEEAEAPNAMFQLVNDFGEIGIQEALPKKAMKKQVHAIRQAMMKHDKKTQRNYAAAHARNEENDDDIVRNMTNLILNKGEESTKPWEKSLMQMETALNSNISKHDKKLRPLLSNGKDESKYNLMLLNPAVESFLSFSLENNQTGLQTHANATMLNQSNLGQPNLLDQTLFTGLNNEDNFTQFSNFPFKRGCLMSNFYNNPDQTFGEAAPLSGYPEMNSATPSKLKNPFIPTAESIFQRRSQALHEKLTYTHKDAFTFTEIALSDRFTMQDEQSSQPREQAVKRFIDLLFLSSGTGGVSMKQTDPLQFSEIEVSLATAPLIA